MSHYQVMCPKINRRNPCLMPQRLSTTVWCCCEERAHILTEFLCDISCERTHGEVFNEHVATRLCATNELCGTFWAPVRYVDMGKWWCQCNWEWLEIFITSYQWVITSFDDECIQITMLHTKTALSTSILVLHTLKDFFFKCSKEKGVSYRSLRFTFKEPLFLISASNKIPTQLGNENQDRVFF